MTTWIRRGSKAYLAFTVTDDYQRLILHDGSEMAVSEAVEDTLTMEWYEDLKNSIGRSVAWLDEPDNQISMWLSEVDARTYYCKVRGITRSGENPVLLLLECVAAQSACYSGWSDDPRVIDCMNFLDEMVVRAYHLTVALDRTTTGYFVGVIHNDGGRDIGGDKNPIFALLNAFIP